MGTMTIRTTKRLIATKSQQLRKYLSEEIYNLETGEYYCSRFHRDAVHIAARLRQRWKPFAFTTACLMLFTMGPAMVACRRRLNGSGDGSHDSTNGLRETYFLRNTIDVNNHHRRLIEDVEIECMQALDLFQKSY